MKKLNSSFIFPNYKDKCFSNIPATIFKLFGIKTTQKSLPKEHFKKHINKDYKNIILFLIDALGFYQWKEYGNKHSLFKQLDDKKCLYPITTIFPSNTAPALNTIHSGLTPAEHGLFEFNLYIKKIDKIIQTLRFKEISSKQSDSLLQENINPKILFNHKTIYEKLKEYKINSTCFISKDYAKSAYSKVSKKSCTNTSFINFSDLVVKLKNQVVKSKGKNYFFVYWDKLDVLAHKYGPSNNACSAELRKISHLFLTEFINKTRSKIKEKTLLIITADHGQIDINPKKTIFLDKDKTLIDFLKKDKKGNPILPSGSPRDVFLHIEKDKLEIAVKYLRNKLKNKARIVKSKDAINSGLFGKKSIKKEYKDRLGDLIILPYKNYTIWRKVKRKKFNSLGYHGGLTKKEMIVPFAICSLDEFQS